MFVLGASIPLLVYFVFFAPWGKNVRWPKLAPKVKTSNALVSVSIHAFLAHF